jgi:hypothetical protein
LPAGVGGAGQAAGVDLVAVGEGEHEVGRAVRRERGRRVLRPAAEPAVIRDAEVVRAGLGAVGAHALREHVGAPVRAGAGPGHDVVARAGSMGDVR